MFWSGLSYRMPSFTMRTEWSPYVVEKEGTGTSWDQCQPLLNLQGLCLPWRLICPGSAMFFSSKMATTRTQAKKKCFCILICTLFKYSFNQTNSYSEPHLIMLFGEIRCWDHTKLNLLQVKHPFPMVMNLAIAVQRLILVILAPWKPMVLWGPSNCNLVLLTLTTYQSCELCPPSSCNIIYYLTGCHTQYRDSSVNDYLFSDCSYLWLCWMSNRHNRSSAFQPSRHPHDHTLWPHLAASYKVNGKSTGSCKS